MKVTNFYIIAACIAGLSACAANSPTETGDSAAAAGAQAQAVASSSAKADKPEKMICKRMVPTGSRIGKKVCATAKQWEATAAASQEALRETTRRATHGNPDSGG